MRSFALDFPADDFEQPDEPWFIEPRDKDPASEARRQRAFLSTLKRRAPGVDAIAVPNAGRRSDWERLERWREGARRGALDLVLAWKPTRSNDRGVYFPEFKNGTDMPEKAQRERLNRYFKMGHGCGVYRNAETLLEHLRAAGAPFLGEARAICDLTNGIVAKARRGRK